MNSKIKKLLYDHCKSHLESRLSNYKNLSDSLYDSLSLETKSSAGDKHETTRAVIQLEREKIGEQIKKVEKDYKLLTKISQNKSYSNVIGLGSVIYTQENQYYLAVSSTPLNYGSKTFYCISSKSPIGLLLLNKKVGGIFEFKGKKNLIIEVL